MASIFLDGLMSGLDTTAIIRQLMSAEAAPKARLELRQATYDKRVGAWGSISTSLGALKTAGNDLLTAQKFNLFKATSSDTSIATATASPSAAPGTFSFRVAALAASHQVMSQGFASSADLVGAGTFTVGQGTTKVGFTKVTASAGLPGGSYDIKVISGGINATAATYTGGPVTNLDFTAQRKIDITVNGQARSVQIASGVYASVDALATAVQTAIGNDVQVTNVNGALRIATTATGSTSSLQITGGTALTKLGWAAMATATTGADGSDAVVEFDGVQTTLVAPGQGQQVTLNGTSGSVTVTLGAALTAGTGKVFATHTDATTTLAGLATKLTSAGVSAQAIDTGSGSSTPFNLVLSASATGTANELSVDTGALTGFTSGFSTLRAAADAQLTLGDGGLTITRSSNTITDVLAGVTLQLVKADSTKDVTVTVDHDADAIVDKVKAFISALNSAVAGMKTHTKAGQISATGELDAKATAGVLWGDGNARRLQKLLADGMWYTGTGTLARASDIGIEVERDGTYTLDETKLREKLASDFDGVVDLVTKDAAAGTDGLVGSMVSIVDAALAQDGLVDSATRTAQRQSDDAGNRIAAFDVRLELIETRYRRQFAAMETLIGQLKNQSNWLAGQIAQLPTSS